MHRYFAYGSNLHPGRLAARVPIVADRGPVTLPGWQLRFHKRGRDGSGKGDIVAAAAGDAVYGALYLLDAQARSALDRIEGLGAGYRVQMLDIPAVGSAYCYVAEPAFVDPARRPFDWYLALVRIGAAYRGAPAGYLARLDAVPAQPDPDFRRAAEAAALLRTFAVVAHAAGPRGDTTR